MWHKQHLFLVNLICYLVNCEITTFCMIPTPIDSILTGNQKKDEEDLRKLEKEVDENNKSANVSGAVMMRN